QVSTDTLRHRGDVLNHDGPVNRGLYVVLHADPVIVAPEHLCDLHVCDRCRRHTRCTHTGGASTAALPAVDSSECPADLTNRTRGADGSLPRLDEARAGGRLQAGSPRVDSALSQRREILNTLA